MAKTELPPSPFIMEPDGCFVPDMDSLFDELMDELAEMPAFLVNPSPEYLEAVEIEPIVRMLAAY